MLQINENMQQIYENAQKMEENVQQILGKVQQFWKMCCMLGKRRSKFRSAADLEQSVVGLAGLAQCAADLGGSTAD